MRKLLAIMLALMAVLTLSGCREMPKYLPSYWDGLTKRGAKEYIQDALEEKYGEEFIVKKMYLGGGTLNTSADLFADCSPKLDENIVFAIQVLVIGDERVLRDTYIQSIVRSEMLNIINSVLSEYSGEYVADVNVQGLYDEYDSEIREAENATIKNYSEALPDINITDIWIALNDENNLFRDNIQFIVEKITQDFYYTHALIHFYYVTDDIVQHCIDESKNSRPTDRLVFYRILYGHYPCDVFNYNGKEGTLFHIDSINNGG